MPANTYIASVLAISYTGAHPVLVDCEPEDFTIDPRAVENALTSRTKAIMPVPLYGHPAEMDPLIQIAQDRKLSVIEDAARAHGAAHKGRLCGTMGDVGCFSFYPGKNLGAFGDGAAIVTRNADLAERVSLLGNYGQKAKSVHTIQGFNSRLDTIPAANLRVKLKYLTVWNEARRVAASYYGQLLNKTHLVLPRVASWAHPVWHLYVIQTTERLQLRETFEPANISYGIHYPIPVHLQEAFRDLGHREGNFPVSEMLTQRILSLPMFPEITEGEIERVAAVLRAL